MGLHHETESAVEVPVDVRVPDLTGIRGVASVDGPEEVDLTAVYVDTARFDLARAGVTLRRRTGGDDEGWHLKVPEGRPDEGGPRRRSEHRLPLGDDVPEELVSLIRSRVLDRALEPRVELRTHRVVHRLRDEAGQVVAEVADDTVHARSADGADLATWREWEVELVDGPEEVLVATARVLGSVPGAGRRASPKLTRALGEAAPAARSTSPRDGSAAEAVRAYLALHTERLLAADPAVRSGEDDGVHDARVSTRRLRTALGVFRPVVDRSVTDPLRDELAELGHVLGAARDAYVERRALRRRVADEDIELVLGPVAQRLDEDRSAARRTAFDALDSWLASDRYLALLASLDALADDLPPGPRADESADRVIPRRARKAWRRLVDAVDVTEHAEVRDDAHDDALHEIRKEARRARYASELAASVVGAPARKSARRAREVQDVLGGQHDSVVRRETLRRIGIQAHLDGENAFTYGRLHALEQAAGAAAERAARRPIRRAVDPTHRRWAR